MKKYLSVLLAAALATGLAGCGKTAAEQAKEKNTNAANSQKFPVKIDSCGTEIELTKAPERVILVGEINAPIIYELGVIDKVIGRAGEKPVSAESPELRAALNKIPMLNYKKGESGGGFNISTEAVLDAKADLVISYPHGVNPDQLKAAGVNLYTPASYCKNNQTGKASFDSVKSEVTRVGKIFGIPEKADELNRDLDSRIAKAVPKNNPARGTGIALFVIPGSTELWTYGTSSMVQPLFEANGLKNAYDSESTRVFEVSLEDVFAKDPDWIVLLSNNSTDEEALNIFNKFSGVASLKASKAHHVVHLPYSFVDPPSTMSIDGVSKLAKLLETHA